MITSPKYSVDLSPEKMAYLQPDINRIECNMRQWAWVKNNKGIMQGARLQKNGRILYIRCLLHSEKTASMRLTPNGHYHCFGCGESGNSWKLYHEYKKIRRDRPLTMIVSRLKYLIRSSESEADVKNTIRTVLHDLAEKNDAQIRFIVNKLLRILKI